VCSAEQFGISLRDARKSVKSKKTYIVRVARLGGNLWISGGWIVAEDDGNAPKKPRGIDLAKLLGDDSATGRLRKQMKALEDPVGLRALRTALGPTSAIQEMMEAHRATIDAAHILPDVSALAGIADAARLAESYRPPELTGLGLADAYKIPEIAAIEAVSKTQLKIMDSFRVGSLADMIGSQSALAALAPSLGMFKTDAFGGLLEDFRVRQSAFGSALDAYMDQQRTKTRHVTGLMEALAIPRIDPASFGIGSVLALSETNAFRIAGLTPDYADLYQSVFGAVNERLSAFADLRATANASALQPDLVGGIGSLLERALAQQESLLQQQRQLFEQTADSQPKMPSRLVQQLHMLAAIVAVLQFFIIIALQIEERMLGGDPATLDNTAAIEENTQAIEQMRDSFDVLAGQLERMHAVQEEDDKEERAADAAIAQILREIADTLADQAEGEEKAP
jgi:hypothetical protein